MLLTIPRDVSCLAFLAFCLAILPLPILVSFCAPLLLGTGMLRLDAPVASAILPPMLPLDAPVVSDLQSFIRGASDASEMLLAGNHR